MIYRLNQKEIEIPLSKRTILNIRDEKLKEKLFDDFDKYFYQKNKINNMFIENDGEVINAEGYLYIDLHKIENIIKYTNEIEKKVYVSLSNIISNNYDEFQSFEKINEEIKSITTDKGMYKLAKLLGVGLEEKVHIGIKPLTLKNLTKLLYLEFENFELEEKVILYLNILKFENKDLEIFIRVKSKKKYIDWCEKCKEVYMIFDNDTLIDNIVEEDYLFCDIEEETRENILKTKEEVKLYNFIFNKKIEKREDFLSVEILKIKKKLTNDR